MFREETLSENSFVKKIYISCRCIWVEWRAGGTEGAESPSQGDKNNLSDIVCKLRTIQAACNKIRLIDNIIQRFSFTHIGPQLVRLDLKPDSGIKKKNPLLSESIWFMKLAYLELNRIGHSKCANLCCSVATLSTL